jgi:hypothetical protein
VCVARGYKRNKARRREAMLVTDDYTNATTERTMPTPEMLQCMRECLNCHAICLRTAMHCLEQGGKHAEAAHIRLLLDCADICQTSANFLMRGSDLHPRTCAVCAEVCRRCAEECGRFGEDAQMKACADTCHACAESCRRMSGD